MGLYCKNKKNTVKHWKSKIINFLFNKILDLLKQFNLITPNHLLL